MLRDGLSGRDLAIVGQVADVRLMTARQIEVIHFAPTDHENAAAAARACRRTLERLNRERLLIRLERRIGGARAGSASFIYALGPLGHPVLALSTHHRGEPSEYTHAVTRTRGAAWVKRVPSQGSGVAIFGSALAASIQVPRQSASPRSPILQRATALGSDHAPSWSRTATVQVQSCVLRSGGPP